MPACLTSSVPSALPPFFTPPLPPSLPPSPPPSLSLSLALSRSLSLSLSLAVSLSGADECVPVCQAGHMMVAMVAHYNSFSCNLCWNNRSGKRWCCRGVWLVRVFLFVFVFLFLFVFVCVTSVTLAEVVTRVSGGSAQECFLYVCLCFVFVFVFPSIFISHTYRRQ
jgi:hypothetical protein